MAEEKKRLQYVDAIKGIAILVIVVYHLLAPCVGKGIVNHLSEIFLACFFFFSGYFYKPGRRTALEEIGNRAKALMVPFFRFSLFFWAVGSAVLVLSKNETVKEAFACLRNFLIGCIWNRTIQDWFHWDYYSLGRRYFFLADFWFLIALLFASILFFPLAKLVMKSKIATVITAVLLFALTGVMLHFQVVLPYNIQLVPFWTALIMLGALAGQLKLMELPGVPKGARWGIGAAALLASLVLAMLKPPSVNMFRGSFGEHEVAAMLLNIAVSIPGVWGLGILFYNMEETGMRLNEIAWVGRNSLIFFVYHMFFAWITGIVTKVDILYKDTAPAGAVWKSVLVTLGVIALCILRVLLENFIKKKIAGKKAKKEVQS